MRLIVLPLLLASVAVSAEQTLFKDVAVFDGEKYVEKTCVVVKDGRIVRVEEDLIALDGSTVIDGAGKTLLPGLHDAHVHTWFPMHMQHAAEFGVTSSFDMMTQPAFVRQMKAAQKKRANGMSDFFASGAAVTVKGGHGTEYGFTVPVLDSAEAAQAFIDERITEGSDYIKLIYDDGRSFGIKFPTLTKEMLKASIEATHKRNKLAVVHVGDLQSAREAIEFGADALMHLFADEVVDDATLRMMVDKKVRVVPTLTVLNGVLRDGSSIDKLLADTNLKPMITKSDTAALRGRFPRRGETPSKYETAVANVKKMRAAGVTILVGTDAPNPATAHGVSVHHELELLVEAGLTPLEALRAATSATADFFRRPDRGRVAVGKYADLLLVQGNPTKDIKATRRIQGVWKAGVAIDLSKRLQRVKDELTTKPAGDRAEELIANFDDLKTSTKFGAGLQQSTDTMFGGSSTVEFAAIAGGANKTAGAIRITGNVQEKQPAYAGMMFYPADQPMQPANLSKHSKVSFWAKGDEADFNVMLFTQKRGFTPSMQAFKTKADWQQFSFAFKDFDGSDGADVLGIYIGSSRAGKFELVVDELKLSGAK